MKNNQQNLSKKDIVSNALGSVRVEGLEPSQSMIAALDLYVAGKKSIEKIIQETKQRYVALQRGWNLLLSKLFSSQK